MHLRYATNRHCFSKFFTEKTIRSVKNPRFSKIYTFQFYQYRCYSSWCTYTKYMIKFIYDVRVSLKKRPVRWISVIPNIHFILVLLKKFCGARVFFFHDLFSRKAFLFQCAILFRQSQHVFVFIRHRKSKTAPLVGKHCIPAYSVTSLLLRQPHLWLATIIVA